MIATAAVQCYNAERSDALQLGHSVQRSVLKNCVNLLAELAFAHCYTKNRRGHSSGSMGVHKAFHVASRGEAAQQQCERIAHLCDGSC